MQKASIKQNEEQCWCLVAGHKHEGVSRVRIVSFIFKTSAGFVVTRTGRTHKNFMSALASLTNEYIYTLRSLIASMLYDDCGWDFHDVFEAALNGVSESMLNDISPFNIKMPTPI
ncbi:hypothetical protein CJG67_003943 [Salmonella enterica subsp. enterica serovar Gaminara]|nr:hypothetical protein [Salmonella enterica subsp. enterica serovar Gaminara]